MEQDPEPWDYEQVCRTAVSAARHLLDLETGGGEFLLLGALPTDTVTTQGWPLNLPVARQALAPHGIPVEPWAPGTSLPFESGRFDLVHSRHAAYDAVEAARVLRRGASCSPSRSGAATDGRRTTSSAARTDHGGTWPLPATAQRRPGSWSSARRR